MLLLGLLGIFWGTLPELFPNAVPIFLVGNNKKLEICYKIFTEHLSIPRGKRNKDMALQKNEDGYKAIYLILSKINPNIVPPLSNKSSKEFGRFSFDKGINFVSSGTFLFLNQVIFYEISTNQWRPICEMRDLFFMIRDSQFRYYARLGFLLVFISILIEGIISLRSAIKSYGEKKDLNHNPSLE